MSDDTRGIRWLHLTDLHVGQPGEAGRYGDIQRALIADLEHLRDGSGWWWDLVVFTGDLAFRGIDSEYAGVTARLQPIVELVSRANGDAGRHLPVLVAVPGNHDLQRPTPDEARSLQELWATGRDTFWDAGSTPIRTELEGRFRAYVRWQDNHPFRRPPDQDRGGLAPGDSWSTVCRGGVRLGLLGLNSSLLHFDGSARGRMDLDVRQRVRFLGGDAGALDECHVTFLLTHHPPDWLSADGRKGLEEILGDGRIQVHLHGHMHEGRHAAQTRHDGFSHRVEGRSLFGAEEDGFDRMHGYGMGEITLPRARKKKLRPQIRLWSRRWNGRNFGPVIGGEDWWITGQLREVSVPKPPCVRAAPILAPGAAPPWNEASWRDHATPAPKDQGNALLVCVSTPVARPGRADDKEAPFLEPAPTDDVIETARAVVAAARELGIPIVSGGHPDVAEVLLRQAIEHERAEDPPWLYLYQHEKFIGADALPSATNLLAAQPGVDAHMVPWVDGDTPKDFARMGRELRERMIQEQPPLAAVFLGGLSGLVEEFAFVGPNVPRYLLASTGGATAVMANQVAFGEAEGRLRAELVREGLIVEQVAADMGDVGGARVVRSKGERAMGELVALLKCRWGP